MEVCLEEVKNLIDSYIEEGKYANVLKNAEAVGYGFADGDIEIAYSK